MSTDPEPQTMHYRGSSKTIHHKLIWVSKKPCRFLNEILHTFLFGQCCIGHNAITFKEPIFLQFGVDPTILTYEFKTLFTKIVSAPFELGVAWPTFTYENFLKPTHIFLPPKFPLCGVLRGRKLFSWRLRGRSIGGYSCRRSPYISHGWSASPCILYTFPYTFPLKRFLWRL